MRQAVLSALTATDLIIKGDRRLFLRRNGGDYAVEHMNNQAQHQVLFVDDDGIFLNSSPICLAPLSGQSWQIHLATSAEAALEILKSAQIDLAVVDIKMPVLDGMQFIGLLQRVIRN